MRCRYRIFWVLVAIGLCVLLAIDPMRAPPGLVADQVAAVIACAFIVALFTDLWLVRCFERRSARSRHPSSDRRLIVGFEVGARRPKGRSHS